jgi:CDP-4-dehydro-6-deoxyglucose reductase
MSHRVTLKPSNTTFEVNDEESVLTAALRQGINLPYGCRSGNCGTCKSMLVSGDIEYPVAESLSLTDEEKQAGATLLCQAHALSDLVIEAHELPPEQDIVIKKLPCRVIAKKLLCHDVIQLKLKLPVMESFAFLAGQYIDILLPDGRHRSFSMANAPYGEDNLELHIRHVEGGNFTGYVFEELQEKSILRVEGPRGQFYLREDSDLPIIFMAGGTGFAPIKSIIEYTIMHSITRPMYLYWGVRAQRDLYMHKHAQVWAQDFSHIQYLPVLSEPQADDDPSLRRGLVHEAIVKDFPDLSGYEVYASGPPPMVYAGQEAFAKCGLPTERYFSDAFEFQAP